LILLHNTKPRPVKCFLKPFSSRLRGINGCGSQHRTSETLNTTSIREMRNSTVSPNWSRQTAPFLRLESRVRIEEDK
jgi:hypothetical protein